MRNSRPHRHPRTHSGFLVVVLIASIAYSGLWLSERIAESRTHPQSATSRTATLAAGKVSWSMAAERAPGGDPRRVLAAAARTTDTRAPSPSVAAESRLQNLPWAPLAAVGAAP